MIIKPLTLNFAKHMKPPGIFASNLNKLIFCTLAAPQWVTEGHLLSVGPQKMQHSLLMFARFLWTELSVAAVG